MVALLVRLKLTLLRNSLRRSLWRTLGLVFGLLYALGLVVAALVGLVALRWTPTGLTGDVTVVVFSVLTFGWLALSLIAFGVDETVDPSKFALLPVRARELLPGLFVSGLIGTPGVATVLVSLGLVVTWARSLPLTLAAVIAFPLGVSACFLMSRAATAAFSASLSSRRFRDLAVVLIVVLSVLVAVGANLLSSLVARAGTEPRALLARAADVLGWTPFGWAWAVPADVADGRWGTALLRLALAAALVVVLWRAWAYFLARRLVEPVEVAGAGGSLRRGTLIERLYPATPTGAVAARSLRYWRRDPRYLAGAVGLLVLPVVLVVTSLTAPDGGSSVLMFTPVLLGLLVGSTLAQDLSYDGTALWLHISCGVTGAADRAGRVLSTLTLFGPLLLLLMVLVSALTRQWHLVVPVAALAVAFTLIGLGVAAYVGSLWQWPSPPPGANPFQSGSSGGLPGLLCFGVSTTATLLLSLPTVALVVGSVWVGWLSYVALGVAVVSGWLVLRTGIRWGGARLDLRWPEVMAAVSERTA